MAGPSWLVDPNRIATKIRSASGACHPEKISWKSNPTKSCPNCHHVIDNSDVVDEWPGLPRGVKFDPSDQEIVWHLLAKVGYGNLNPHPFIDEFIPTVDEDDGICYTHPQNLPGVKQDGSVAHFFHRAIKAYNTGTRKRRKIHGDELGDVRWHKTGRTKPVFLNGVQKACKKIMVLYISPVRGGKAEKTNWVMHQYHLGTGEDEKEGEYVISKVFYQQQPGKATEKGDEDVSDGMDAMIVKVDPVTPKSVTPEPPRSDMRFPNEEIRQESPIYTIQDNNDLEVMVDTTEQSIYQSQYNLGPHFDQMEEKNDDEEANAPETHFDQMEERNDDEEANNEWCGENDSQFLLSSQQLVEHLSICDEFLQSQSPNRDNQGIREIPRNKPRLSDYSHLGPEDLKRDLEECQQLVVSDPATFELDTPPDFRLSQLEFESQDSYAPFGIKRAGTKTD